MELEKLLYRKLKNKTVARSGNIFISRSLFGKSMKHFYTTYGDKEIHVFIERKNLKQKKETPKAPPKEPLR